MKRTWITALICGLVLQGLCLPASAQSASGMRRIDDEPVYESITYIRDENNAIVDVLSPAAYRPVFVVDSASMQAELQEPADLFVLDDDIYIVDCAGNKIFITDPAFNIKKVIQTFENQGETETFASPEGVYATADKLYVADTGNHRIVVLNHDGSLSTIIGTPDSESLSDSLVFEPRKIAADGKGRVYAVVKGVYEGIMELYEDGTFGGFVGSIPVDPDPLTLMWKTLMSREQGSKLENFIPVEYTNLTLDDGGFLYAVSQAAENQDSIRRLNAAGDDSLVRESLGAVPVSGIIAQGDDLSSSFVDIASPGDGDDLFFALDRNNSRVFVYDGFGNLLFTFGGTSTGQTGTFQRASAIALHGDRVLVADMNTGIITVFEPTEYASMILQGLQLYNDDQYAECIPVWTSVLTANRNYRLAYDKIGLALYQTEQYDQAMSYFKTAGDQENYSKAFSRVRQAWLTDNFLWVILGLLALVIVLVLLVRLIRARLKKNPVKRGGALDSLGYVFYVMLHPFDGFWDLKHEKRGRLWVSTLIILLLVISFGIERGVTGFALAANPFGRLDWGYVLKLVLIPLILFWVANMSVTSLMDGKGTFKQLYMATGYVFTPLVLVKIPLTLLSNFMTTGERMFISLITALALVYVCLLAFAALSSTHEYTGGKTVGVFALSGVVMVIISFICVLFFFLFSEIVSFVYTVIEEVRYR